MVEYSGSHEWAQEGKTRNTKLPSSNFDGGRLVRKVFAAANQDLIMFHPYVLNLKDSPAILSHLWTQVVGSSDQVIYSDPDRAEAIIVYIQKLSLIADFSQWYCQITDYSQLPYLNSKQRQ
jgi:hypothetical protein